MGQMKFAFSAFLWLTCCLSCLQGNHTYGAMDYHYPSDSMPIYSGGVWPLVIPPLFPPGKEQCTLTCAPCPAQPLIDRSYKDLSQALSLRFWRDTRTLCSTALNTSSNYLQYTYDVLSNAARNCFGQVLWFLVYLWTGILQQAFWTAFSVVTGYYLQVASLMSLAIITSWIYKALKWTFGTLPALACIKLVRTILRVLTCKRYFNEKSVDGYDSYSVPQTPPRKSVFTIRRKDKSHIGYATCITLFNKMNAVVTSEHNLEEGCEFYSPRTGRSIPIAEFTTLYTSSAMDISILTGPNNWESVLGCKGVFFTTYERLAQCPAQLYVKEGEDWRAHSAKVVGHFDNFAQVLSNTKPGFSGAGYFHGKTLVGVHKGHAGKEYNFNLMAPLPAIPGVTSPQYVVESDPPQGLVFPTEVADQISSLVKQAYNKLNFKHDNTIHAKDKQWKHGVAWADMEDESGNAKAAASAVPTAAASNLGGNSNTPAGGQSNKTVAPSSPKVQKVPAASRPTRTTPTMTRCSPDATATSPDTGACTGPSQQEIMNNLMNLLVQKIDVSKIEKSVIDLLASKALKKPRGKRGSNKRHNNGDSSSPTSTPGKYQPPNKRSQASNGSDNSPHSTIHDRKQHQRGGNYSVPNTLSWVRKLPVSDGPKSGHPQN
nr:P1 [Barley yellow dwarf virus]